MRTKSFQKTVLGYYHRTKRQLPWRNALTPYKVVVSEIMLQQTQADRVIPKFTAFVRQFPNFKALANAPQTDILRTWSGLGYNRRALALKKLAGIVTTRYRGKLPQTLAELDALPGIGPATAAAILCYAFNTPEPFIETNVRSVYIHHFFPKKKAVPDSKLWPLITATMDRRNPREWFYALMDYGVYLKKQFKNPSRKSAHYSKQGKFKGSNRELRGRIVKLLLSNPELTTEELYAKLDIPNEKINTVLQQLSKEGYAIIP